MMTKTRRVLTAVAAAGLFALGVAAPAMAEGSRTSHMTNWQDGDGSSNWTDTNRDNANTHVTFYSCTREFKATIRKTIALHSDPVVGPEWINCRSYADAVNAGDLAKGNYHFDVTGMGLSSCASWQCGVNRTSVPKLRIHW